jgi:trans-aconitate methyltransferase
MECRPHGWAAHWAAFGAPAREAVALVAGAEADTSVLDLGCGSGEFCALAAARGARVSGIDAAEGLVEIVRQSRPTRIFESVPSSGSPGPMTASMWSRGSTSFSSPPTSLLPSPKRGG